MSEAREGDMVLFISKDRKRFLVRLTAGGTFQTHRGVVQLDDVIGRSLGRQVRSHLEAPFLVLEPSTDDLIRKMKRTTQIMYPKDIGYAIMKLGLKSGDRVVEAGTGSGGLSIALARAVGPSGRVYSYDTNGDALRLARKNLESVGLAGCVELKERDIALGFDETDADSLFLDVREPWQYLRQAKAALKGGGFFGAIVPTTNQVIALLDGLAREIFALIEVEELILRPYKAVPGRLRPCDRIIGHTGFLIFARSIDAPFGTLVGHGAGKVVWPPDPDAEAPGTAEE